MILRGWICWALLLVTAGARPAAAVTTSFWTVDTQEEMTAGEAENLSITSEGKLVLSPEKAMLLDRGDLYVWALARGPKGEIYAGTGDNGVLYRIREKGEPEVFFDSLELEILSVVVDRDGTVYAGTSPDGMVFRISPDGKSEVLLDSPEDYVWDLVLDGEGGLYAATGGEGRVYRISSNGKAEVLYDSNETHIMCLYRDPKRGLFAGTEGNGLLYRITGPGKAEVVYDADLPEISAITMDKEGNLFAAAVEAPADADAEAKDTASKSSILRITPDGAVSLYWDAPVDFVYDLEMAEDGRLLVATGGKGELYTVGEHGEWWRVLDLEEVQILDIVEDRGALVIGTGNAGRVYRLGPEAAPEGTFTSKPFEARTEARWGTLRWEGECPAGAAVSFSMRTGNTKTPDETWSEWAAETREPAVLPVPNARFAQWRARMSAGEKGSPSIESVTVAYLDANLPPRMSSLHVLPSGQTFFEGVPDATPPPVTQVLPEGVQIQYSISGFRTPPLPEEELGWVRSYRTVRWEASDPNGDALLFDVHFRAEGETRWKVLEKDLEDPVYSWNSLRLPDGRYRVRVTARDTPSNPAGTVLADEMVSDPFEIDNTAPVLSDLVARVDGKEIAVTGRAKDGTSALKKGRCVLDGGPWIPLLAADGLFDELEESLDFRLPIEEPGEHTVLIQVVDAAGNLGVGSVSVK